MTSAYDCRIVTRSFWRSSTAWLRTFSGSSSLPNTLLMFASATRLKRSKKFIWSAVVGLARVVEGRRAVLGANADTVVRTSAARRAMAACDWPRGGFVLWWLRDFSFARRFASAAAEIFAENYV
jgi:hypothetical protein